MSNKKKTISDDISEFFTPKPLVDPENDASDVTRARIADYILEEDDDDVEQQLSEFRKKNVLLLNDVDKKYRGSIVSRRDIDKESNNYEDDEDDDDEDEDEDEDKDDSENGELQDSSDEDPFGIEKTYDDSESDDDDDLETYKKSKKLQESSDEDTFGIENVDVDDSESDLNSDIDEEDGSGDEDLSDEDDEDEDDEEEEDDDDDEQDNILNIIKKQSNTLISNLTENDKTSAVKKGLAVQNQLKMWEKLLEIRIQSQKLLIGSNSLPTYNFYPQLLLNEEFKNEVKKTEENVENLLDKLLNLQSLLISQYSETKDLKIIRKEKRKHENISAKEKSGNDDDDDDDSSKTKKQCTDTENILENNYLTYKPYLHSVINKWFDKTKIFSTKKKQSDDDDYHVMKKIEFTLANKAEQIKKTQLYKGGFPLFNETNDNSVTRVKKYTNRVIHDENEIKNQDKNEIEIEEEIGNEIYFTEIYDDSDFYHQILRELIEYKTTISLKNPNDITKQYAELEKMRTKMKRKVDTRASKGRKIRYAVHKKLINFMPPNPHTEWTNEAKDELFNSLFGKK